MQTKIIQQRSGIICAKKPPLAKSAILKFRQNQRSESFLSLNLCSFLFKFKCIYTTFRISLKWFSRWRRKSDKSLAQCRIFRLLWPTLPHCRLWEKILKLYLKNRLLGERGQRAKGIYEMRGSTRGRIFSIRRRQWKAGAAVVHRKTSVYLETSGDKIIFKIRFIEIWNKLRMILLSFL